MKQQSPCTLTLVKRVMLERMMRIKHILNKKLKSFCSRNISECLLYVRYCANWWWYHTEKFKPHLCTCQAYRPTELTQYFKTAKCWRIKKQMMKGKKERRKRGETTEMDLEPTEFVQPLNQQLLKTGRCYRKREATEKK